MYQFGKTILTWLKLSMAAIILLCVSFNFFSCSSSSSSSTTNILGAWTQESSVDAGARSGAVLFTIGDKIYISTGFNGNNRTNTFLKDVWEYDSKIDTWKLKKSFPGVARSGATAFSANGKGYVGLGYDGNKYLKDFWVYEPTVGDSGTWTMIAKFPGAARRGAFAFTINDVGYVGTGNDDNLYYKDFYQYEANGDKWIQRPAVPKTERTNAFSFVIGNYGYVGGGTNNGSMVQDFYQYDPGDGDGVWYQKYDLMDDPYDTDPNDKGYIISRDQAVAFVIDGKGYVVGGKRQNALSGDIWEYTPSELHALPSPTAPPPGTEVWLKKQNFGYNVKGVSQGAPARIGGVGFSLNGFGYVCAGNSGSLYLNDKWSYNPKAVNQ